MHKICRDWDANASTCLDTMHSHLNLLQCIHAPNEYTLHRAPHCIEYVGKLYVCAILRSTVKICHVRKMHSQAMQMNLVVKFVASQALSLPSVHLLDCKKKSINLYNMGGSLSLKL